MPYDPTGRYKGNNFDPNYAAKRKAKMEQQQQYPQRYQKDNYDQRQRPRDNGYTSRNERDGRGWQGPSSLDYGHSESNSYSTPRRRDTQWDNHSDRRPGASHGYRPFNTHSKKYSIPRNSDSQKSPTSPMPRDATRVVTSHGSSQNRDMDATLKDLSNLVGIEPPAALSGSSNAGAGVATGPGELSSLEKLKLFKAQVEASRAARSTDASSTFITQVAESFLQRENSSTSAEHKTAPPNDKAQALKAKLKALKQQKVNPAKETGSETQCENSEPQPGSSSQTKPSQDAAPTNQSTASRPEQTYPDAARDNSRRRSASPRVRAASPGRYTSRTNNPQENNRYADEPPEYSEPRNRRDVSARYDHARKVYTPRQTRASVAHATPMAVLSTSINLVVKTLEVIKAQVEQLEVLIQPMLDAQGDGSVSSQNRASPTEVPPPAAHRRRSSYDSYDQALYRRRYDDDDGAYHRSSRGGFKRGLGGHNNYNKNYEGHEWNKRD